MRYVLLAWSLCWIACVDTTPSSGRCTGTVDGVALDEAIVPAESYFYRDDDILGDEDGPLVMKYARVSVSAQFDDMPDKGDEGTYPITDPRLDFWYTTVSDSTASPATLTVTRGSRERLVGQFTFATPPEANPGQVVCTFNLRRAYEKDTDD